MIEIGKNNKLKIISINDNILKLDAEEYGTLEVENTDLFLSYKSNQFVDVFIIPENETIKAYLGSAYTSINEFSYLCAVDNTNVGAFFDIGIEKDLLCPFKEQKTKIEIDKYYIVYTYIDESTNRLVASTKFENYLSTEKPQYNERDEVNILIINKTNLGYKAIVENKHIGLLYDNKVFANLKIGNRYKAIVTKVREDDKIDLQLYKNDSNDILAFENLIIDYLKKHNGKMLINDDTDPKIIYDTFGISKKNFKKAIGALYRKQLIDLQDEHIKLI